MLGIQDVIPTDSEQGGQACDGVLINRRRVCFIQSKFLRVKGKIKLVFT